MWTEAHLLYEALAHFVQNMLRSTLLHANKTTKKCIQFLNESLITTSFFFQTFGFILFVCKNGHIRIKNFWFYLHFFSCQIKMVGYDQLHIMTNHPIKYESYRTNDLRGVTFTKWSQTDEQMTRQTEKLYAPYYQIQGIKSYIIFVKP